jgi:hypothetical protein
MQPDWSLPPSLGTRGLAWLLSHQIATMRSRSLNGWSGDEPVAGLVADPTVAVVA